MLVFDGPAFFPLNMPLGMSCALSLMRGEGYSLLCRKARVVGLAAVPPHVRPRPATLALVLRAAVRALSPRHPRKSLQDATVAE